MDIQMPEMDGYEATRQIRGKESENKDVPIFGLTASAYSHDKIKCLDSGMKGVITKPIRRQQFLNQISQLLSSKNNWQQKSISGISQSDDSFNNRDIPIDYFKVIYEFGGNKKLIDSVINQFLINVSSQIESLRKALKRKDMETLRRDAHKICSGALNLNAMPLAHKAKELERHAASGNLELSEDSLNNLDKDLKKLIQFFNKKKHEPDV
ncbi:unnamed protein product [marine sediment metagenome]|uniref:Response regulatory domain-containing protein n=1 Tax=marine sediment metagenome TaxID=412755 RepID=X0VWJ6_9ZZZZ